jgi:hypothetical protein
VLARENHPAHVAADTEGPDIRGRHEILKVNREETGEIPMGKNDTIGLSRRRFVASLPPLMCGGLAAPSLAERLERVGRGTDRQGPGFWAPYSAAEQQAVSRSVMAQDITNYIGHGFGCAECSYMVGLRFLGEPEARLSAAACFSGGFGQGDLCGFLTGGMMAIGVAAGKLHPTDRRAMREYYRPRSQAYWEWWTSRGTLHCSELRELYNGSEEFLRMGQRAVVKVEELVATARGDDS